MFNKYECVTCGSVHSFPQFNAGRVDTLQNAPTRTHHPQPKLSA